MQGLFTSDNSQCNLFEYHPYYGVCIVDDVHGSRFPGGSTTTSSRP